MSAERAPVETGLRSQAIALQVSQIEEKDKDQRPDLAGRILGIADPNNRAASRSYQSSSSGDRANRQMSTGRASPES
jgi:hypothetical protein